MWNGEYAQRNTQTATHWRSHRRNWSECLLCWPADSADAGYIGGSWVSGLTAFEPYRPVFIALVAILLAWAGWQLYRPIEQCPEGSVCAIPSARLRYRLIFWFVLLVAIVLVTSPYWIPVFA